MVGRERTELARQLNLSETQVRILLITNEKDAFIHCKLEDGSFLFLTEMAIMFGINLN